LTWQESLESGSESNHTRGGAIPRPLALGLLALVMLAGVAIVFAGAAFSGRLSPAAAHVIDNDCSVVGVFIDIRGEFAGTSDEAALAVIGDEIEYTVTVSLNDSQCPITDGEVALTLPDGTPVVLDSALSLASGTSATYMDAAAYTVAGADLGTQGAPAGAVRATTSLSATSHRATGLDQEVIGSANYDTEVEALQVEGLLVVRKVNDLDGDGELDSGESFIAWDAEVSGGIGDIDIPGTSAGAQVSVDPGTYTVIENLPSPWENVGYDVDGGTLVSGDTSAVVDVPEGGTTTVTFYNRILPATPSPTNTPTMTPTQPTGTVTQPVQTSPTPTMTPTPTQPLGTVTQPAQASTPTRTPTPPAEETAGIQTPLPPRTGSGGSGGETGIALVFALGLLTTLVGLGGIAAVARTGRRD
jgi:uncharacterized repeat protein (TIGR01451 family)